MALYCCTLQPFLTEMDSRFTMLLALLYPTKNLTQRFVVQKPFLKQFLEG
jgi:hypothetical protein